MHHPKKSKSQKFLIEFSRNAIFISNRLAADPGPRTDGALLQSQKLDLQDAAGLTSRLQSELQSLNVRPPFAAIVCLPRSVACIQVVEVPFMDNRELIAAVNLELEGTFGEEKDHYASDFLSIGSNGDTSQYAVIYSVPKRSLDSVQKALSATNIAVERVTLSEFSFCVANAAQGIVHKLALHGNRLNAMICFRGIVVQSQAFEIDLQGTSDFSQYRGTLRRLQASLPASMQAFTPSHELVLVRSEPVTGLESGEPESRSCFELSLTEQCRLNNYEVQERSLQEVRKLADCSAGRSVDFANPKKIVAPLISRRQLSIILCVLALLAAICFWGMKQYESADLLEQIRIQKEKMVATEKKIAELSGRVESATRLTQWDECNVNWNEQIIAITGQVGKSTDLYLVRLQMDNRNFWERKPVARLEGRAKSSSSILQMTRNLGKENPSFSVQPNGIEPNSVDPEFNSQFRVEIQETVDPSLAETPLLGGE